MTVFVIRFSIQILRCTKKELNPITYYKPLNTCDTADVHGLDYNIKMR